MTISVRDWLRVSSLCMDGHGAPVQPLPGNLFCGAGVEDHVHPNCRIDDVRLVVILSFIFHFIF